MDFSRIEENLKYEFTNKQLLKKALTHTSYAYENKKESNEKLEFLGDSILEYVSSEYIYINYPDLTEGEMTKVRATVVCGKSLATVAKLLDFSDFLFLGKSEKISDGKNRIAVLEDSFEAVIAAIYLDGGIEPARKFIIENLKEPIRLATENVGNKDYKTVLQEELQKNGDVKIEYITIKESGPDHNKTFNVEVKCNDKVLAQGEGKSKKQAEMQAAQRALADLKK